MQVMNHGRDRKVFGRNFATGILVDVSALPADKQAYCARLFSVIPVISDLVSTPTDTGAVVTWTTDVLAGTRFYVEGVLVYYDPTPTLEHEVTLTGLTPETEYEFEAASRSAGMGTKVAEDSLTTEATP